MKQKKTKPKSKRETASAQRARFVAKAKELGADESGEAFDRGFRKIVPEKRARSSR